MHPVENGADYCSMRGSIPLSGAMIKYEIEYYENIKKQVKILERIAKSLETIANEQARKRRENDR